MFIAYFFIVILGFCPFLIILYRIRKVEHLKKYGGKSTGTVLQLKGSGTKSINSVVIRYFLENSKHYVEKEINVAGMPYHVGQELPLYYDRNDPHKMSLDSGKAFIPLVIFTLLIAAFSIVACFLINRSISNGEL